MDKTMAHKKVYDKNIEKLVNALPMDDITFTIKLSSNEILPDGVGDHIKSLPTQPVKADYYLKKVIKPSLDIGDTTEFKSLLNVMEKCEFRHVERLASTMKADIDKESKAKPTSKATGKTTASVSAKASESKEAKGKKPDDAKASKGKEAKGKKSDDAKVPSKAGAKRASPISEKSSGSSEAKRMKSTDECSKAIEYIKDNYIKLTRGLPIDDLLPNLYGKKVVNDVQKEDIHMKKSRKDKVSYLFDNVVIPELDIGASTKYNNLIKVMEASDDTTAKHLAKLLKGTNS